MSAIVRYIIAILDFGFLRGIRIPDHSASKSKFNVGRRWAFGRAVVAAAAPAAVAVLEITVIRLTHRRPSTRLSARPAVVGLTLTGLLRTLRRRAG